MSADDGIYILKTKDGQYRVAWEMAIEKIFKNSSNKKTLYNTMECFLIWGHCKCTKDLNTAYRIAEHMGKKRCTEYGIKVFEIGLTWKHLVHKAKIDAEKLLNEELSGDNDIYKINKYKKILNTT